MGDVTAADLTQLDTVDELLAKRLLQRGLNRGEFSRQFDKDGLARCHMAAAREYRKMLDEADELPLIYHLLEKQRVPIPVESLNKIDLRYGSQREHSRVLDMQPFGLGLLLLSCHQPASCVQWPGSACG